MGVRSTNPLQSFIDDFYRSGTDASGSAPAGSGVKATGGDVNGGEGYEPGNGYAYHTFTTTGSGTFTVNTSLTA